MADRQTPRGGPSGVIAEDWQATDLAERGCAYNRAMRRVLDLGLIVGFLAVDFLFFHDILKAGEVTTLPQYMTGLLSLLVLAICSQSLLKARRS